MRHAATQIEVPGDVPASVRRRSIAVNPNAFNWRRRRHFGSANGFRGREARPNEPATKSIHLQWA